MALAVLRELYNVVVWTSYHHSPRPGFVPLQSAFDPELAAELAPLPRAEAARLAQQLQARDEAHARELAVRIDDARPSAIVSASCGIEGQRVVEYKPLLDKAVEDAAYRGQDPRQALEAAQGQVQRIVNSNK